ncbi:MAG: outer membrane beta-barrel protein [Nitrospira sp.]|nr:outer membrane beta-barrel protein [Nitrospira sp.]
MKTNMRFGTLLLATIFACVGSAHAAEDNSLYVEAFGGNAGNVFGMPDGKNNVGASFDGRTKSIDMSRNGLFGVRMGYKISSNWHTDLSYYSVDSDLDWSASFPPTTAFPQGATTNFIAELDSQVLLVSAYYSFNSESKLSPYVGLGLGVARNKLHRATESFEGQQFASIKNSTQQSVAYRAAVGADYSISEKWKLNMDLSLINLSEATSGATRTLPGGLLEPIGRYEFDDIWRASFTLGLRYSF